jgi:copper chaperone CopZ
MIKKKYKIVGMHCTSCAMLIEGELEDIGVVAKVNYAKQELEVEFDEKKIEEERIKKAVKKAGYEIINS